MINRWEVLFLLFMTLPIMGHVVILPLLFDVAGRDSWICVLLSLPIAFLFTVCIYVLKVKNSEKNFREMVQSISGNIVGWIIGVGLALYFAFLSAFSIASLADMTHVAFIPETPCWALSIWALLFCYYAAKQGVKKIAMIAGVLAFIAVITGHSITVLSTGKKEFANLLPILEYGWTPVLIGTLLLTSIWMELAFLMIIPMRFEKGKKLLLFWVIGVILNAIMMLSTTTGTIMVFGAGQTDNMIYPALEVVRLITLGFIDRFDIYGLILMSFGCFIRGSLYLRIAYDLVYPNESKQNNWILLIITVAVGGLSCYLSRIHLRMEQFTIYYAYSILLLPLPFLLLIISRFRKKKH